MNLIKGKITKEFTLDEVNALNELIMRDVPKAIKAEEYQNKTDDETSIFYYCAVCGAFLGRNEAKRFCPACGQRQDMEIIEL